MFFNDLKIAFRNIRRNKSFSIISISGLTLGILSCIAVCTVVLDNWSYDTHWDHKDDLYRIISVRSIGDGVYDKFSSSWAGFRVALKDNFPEVEAVTSIYKSDYHIKKSIDQEATISFNAIDTDTLIWQTLNFSVRAGNPKSYTHGIANLVLTKSLKEKLFPDEDAIGKKVFSISGFDDEPTELLVVGVIDDIPSNTHLRSQALVIRKGRVEALNKKEFGTFNRHYLRLKSGSKIEDFSNKMNNWYGDFTGKNKRYSYDFQSIKDVYLNSEFDDSLDVKGDSKVNYILIGVALLLLSIGCVNFINLSVANSISKVKNVGIRKIIGSSRAQIVYQFLTESLIYFLIATVTALVLFQLLKSSLETYLSYSIEFSFLSHTRYIVAILLVVLLLTLLAGIYPALLVSGFKSINSIKGQVINNQVSSQQKVQKVLLTTQFSIALFVLVSLFVVDSQYKYMTTKDIGYNKNNLLTINTVSWNGKAAVFQNKIQELSDVESLSMADWRPTSGSGGMSRLVEDPYDPDQKIVVYYMVGDVNFSRTIGLELKDGRLLDPNKTYDIKRNESTIALDGEKEPDLQPSLITEYTAEILHVETLNKIIPNAETVPVGIVKNFHTKSLHEDLVPVIIKAESDFEYSGMFIKLREGYSKEALNKIYSAWTTTFPNKYLNIDWVDQLVDKQYAKEKKLYEFFMFFGILCLFLAAMGVYGLVAQSTQQRFKEIGIRKVLGASVHTIIMLFSKEYVKLVTLAIIIAIPLAWYACSRWLEDFVYRTSINWTILVLASSIVFTIALSTVYIQSLKAARSNPIKSLKSE